MNSKLKVINDEREIRIIELGAFERMNGISVILHGPVVSAAALVLIINV